MVATWEELPVVDATIISPEIHGHTKELMK